MAAHRWLAGAAMTSIATQALANGDHGQRAFEHPHMWGGGGMIFGAIVMILVVAAIIGLVVLTVRWFGGGPARRGSGRTALDILEERFARGEIDAQEFQERRRTLGE